MKKTTEVIFQNDCLWGKKNEKKKLKRNFAYWLIQQNVCLVADENNLKIINQQKEAKGRKIAEKDKELQKKQESLEKLTLRFQLPKQADKEKTFGSINIKNIIDYLEKEGFSIKKKQILFFKPLKKIGEKLLLIRLDANHLARVKMLIE